MTDIGIGIIGTGYMGKLHSVAMHSVGTVFNTRLRPVCEMICSTTEEGASQKAKQFGFNRSTADWRTLVNDEKVQAIVIASPQSTHLEIAREAFALGKPVLCEKPMGASLEESRKMAALAEKSGVTNMVGFNYIRTPASQFARALIANGEIGRLTYFRGEHTEDFFADPETPGSWRTEGRANGTMGDLSAHMINAAHALLGPIKSLCADIETVTAQRPGDNGPVAVTNDDHGQFVCRFENGVMGHLFFSRVATGRKMGYIYEITGTTGAIRFDQEDQNAIWLYKRHENEAEQGFKKILTNTAHPDYVQFCLGPGHGTGYQDQITIEARDFLQAIDTGEPLWPTFEEGVRVNQVIEAAWRSNDTQQWVNVADS